MRSIHHIHRHIGGIKLLGPNPRGNYPPVGIKIAEEALPAVGALEMKVKRGVQIPGPQNDNNQTPPSSKQVEGSVNHFWSGRSCPHTHETQGPGCWKETEGMQWGNITPNGLTTTHLASKVKGTLFFRAVPLLTLDLTDFRKYIPLLSPNGQAPNHALLQKCKQGSFY